MSTGDREIPWGSEPLHPRLLWERRTRAVQPSGTPVRPGWGIEGPLQGLGWAATDLWPGLLLRWQVGLPCPWREFRPGPLAAEPAVHPRCRYVVEPPQLPLAARLKPPFLRPELLGRAAPLKVKLSDNGLKASLGRSKVGTLGWARGWGGRQALEAGSRHVGGALKWKGGVGQILRKGRSLTAQESPLSPAPGPHPARH